MSYNRNHPFLFLGDIAFILAAIQLSSWIRFGTSFNVFTIHTGATFFTLLVYIVMLYIFDLYNMARPFLPGERGGRMTMAIVMAGSASAILFYSLPHWEFGRGIFLIQMILIWGILFCWRWLFSITFAVAIRKLNILIIGAGKSGAAIHQLLEKPRSPYKVVGFLDDDPAKQGKTVGSSPVLGTTDRLQEIANQKGIKTAILAINHNRPPELIARLLKGRLHGLTIMDMPAIYEQLTNSVPVEHLRDDWLLFSDGFYLTTKQYVQRIKRLIDFVASSIILIVSLPIMAITAVTIRISSPGPVFFKQKRIGKHGEVFIVWKFRSMVEDAEHEGAMWAEKDDRRMTGVGRVIRIMRIDELPQIFNVFCGEMSLIGPRPERPEFVRELEARIPYYGIRHSVLPGISGWAQVNYQYGASVEDALKKLEYDVYYIKNMSLLLDINILLKTIGVVLYSHGAR